MQIVDFIITLSIIFTTVYSFGFIISNLLYGKKKIDVFFQVLIGYIFIGSTTVVFHFFFNINNFYSLSIIFFGLFFFVLNYSKINKLEYFKLIVIVIISSFILVGYSDHSIDANMYHHPYVSYLKSEKIIFAIANIQFRFGHISFLQYVQASLSNDYFDLISLASLNIIFYVCFILFLFREIINTRKINIVFIVKILFGSFLLIKFARYREYGNDLIPLLVSIYFLINILNLSKNKFFSKKDLINISLPFLAFMFVHKISYVFAFLIFLPLFNFKNLKFLYEIKLVYFLIFLTILIPWSAKNYFVTSCLAYPVELSCYSNSLYELSGASEPKNVSWLTEIWAKAFIDHPNWQEIDLNEYIKGFNWVSTWFKSHFLKILEIVSPMLILIIILTLFLIFKRKEYLFKKNKRTISKYYFSLWCAIFFGLMVWFFKAPIFRYGSFYIISLIVVSFLVILDYFFKFKKSNNLKFLKILFFISLSFFVIKNTLRISKSSNPLLPKSSKDLIEFNRFTINNLEFFKPKNSVCYYNKFICSHEIPEKIEVKKISNYYFLIAK